MLPAGKETACERYVEVWDAPSAIPPCNGR